MFDYDEDYMVGEYTVNDVNYRIVGIFEFAELNFNMYSTTHISDSTYTSENSEARLVHCEKVEVGFIYTDYLYENETINCTIRNSKSVDGETIPNKLTFEKVGTISFGEKTRWYSESMDMYLDSFSGIDGYLSGEIIIDGKKCHIHALEVGNNNCFLLTIENGILDNLIPKTMSSFICMYFELTENEIIAKVNDDIVSQPEAYPYWEKGTNRIIFTRIPSE